MSVIEAEAGALKLPQTTPSTGQLMSVVSVGRGIIETEWADPGGGGGPAGSLDDLSDVTVTAPVIGDALLHDGAGQFANRPLVEADISDLGSYIGEAPNDGQQYVRQSLDWSVVAAGGVEFPLLAPNGSAAAPSYAFSDAPGTGIYTPGSNVISTAHNGVAVWQFLSDRIQPVVGGCSVRADEFMVLQNGVTARGLLKSASWSPSYVELRHASVADGGSTYSVAVSQNGQTLVNSVAGQTLLFRIGNGDRFIVGDENTSTVHLVPNSDGALDLGSVTAAWRNIYGTTVATVTLDFGTVQLTATTLQAMQAEIIKAREVRQLLSDLRNESEHFRNLGNAAAVDQIRDYLRDIAQTFIAIDNI